MRRRSFLKGAVAGAAVAGTAVVSSGCAAAPAAAPAGSWITTLTTSVGATLIAETIKATFKQGWDEWRKPTESILKGQADQGWSWYGMIYGHAIPAATLVGCCLTDEGNRDSDRFVVIFKDGSAVVLDSWAWRSLDTFMSEETKDKKGDDLIRLRQLLAKTVLPVGPSSASVAPSKTTGWLSYPARDGQVELSWSSAENGGVSVRMTVTGLYSGAVGKPTTRTFTL